MRRTLITRRTLMTYAAAAAVVAGLMFPAAAQAAAHRPPATPKPLHSLYVAGYRQVGCKKGPLYIAIKSNLVVPAATDLNGPPGESSDIINIGGLGSGVTAGIFVGSNAGLAYYHTLWNWEGTTTSGGAPFPISPGDVLELSLDFLGSSGWQVQIDDATTQQDYSQTFVGPITPTTFCEVGAYEQSPFPHYDVTTQTSPIAFYDTRVTWDESVGGYKTTRLLGTLPAHAKLYRYNLINTGLATVAVTSKPMYHSNFTITDK